jgi:chromosome segregation ATPase
MAGPKSAVKDDQGMSAMAGLAGGEGTAGVEKIRELLFGNQMSDYDRRFATLEDRFQQSLRDLESEASRNLAGLESTMKKQLESCVNQLREEKDLRTEADKELGRDLREQAQSLDKRLGQLSDQLARVEREFTDRLGHETQSLREEIKRRNDDLRTTIERMFAELSSVKTDRNLLAGLFVEIAKCLNQDITPKRIANIPEGQ